MTLGEFRTYTESLSDDIELNFAYGEDVKQINTFINQGHDKLIFCNNVYGDDMFKVMLKAFAFLKKENNGKN